MSPVSRRDLLVGGIASGISASGAGLIAGQLANSSSIEALTALRKSNSTAVRDASEPFFGSHQSGVELDLQTFTNFLAFELDPDVKVDDFERWMWLLTDDISRLTSGQPVLADSQPQLAIGPARLTVTLGLGPGLFATLNAEHLRPEGIEPVPTYAIDRLQEQFSGGDLLLHVSADDPIVLSHAVRALVRDSLPFGRVKWVQHGFSNAQGVTPGGVRQRNLMGQVDGTDNPELHSPMFAKTVWIDEQSTDQPWAVGGTQLVLRRIAMKLDSWDKLGRVDKERVIGRNLENGAPIGKKNENDIPDFSAKRDNGLYVIPSFAHIRNASAQTADEVFFRRPFNYDVGISPVGSPDVGLLWTAYARNLSRQYVPVQNRLAKADFLNLWTTPIGSSVWFIVPGVKEPGHILCGSFIQALRG